MCSLALSTSCSSVFEGLEGKEPRDLPPTGYGSHIEMLV